MDLHCTQGQGVLGYALDLQYNWTFSRLPSNSACGSFHTTEHARFWLQEGFPSIRHNKIQDLTAHLMTEVCKDVRIEPDLQPLTGEHLDNITAITRAGWHLLGYFG